MRSSSAAWRKARLLPALLLLASFSSVARAEEEQSSDEQKYNFFSGSRTPLLDKPVEISVVRAASAPNFGYTPVHLSLQNHTGQPQRVELVYQPSEGNHPVTRTAELGPRERRLVLLSVPAASRRGDLRARVPAAGAFGSQHLYFEALPSRAILFEGSPEQFQAAVNASPSTAYDGVSVSTLSTAELPDELAALLGFDTVAVSARFTELSDPQRRALEAYAATGGSLVLLDPKGVNAEHLPLLPSRDEGDHAYGFGKVRLCRGAGWCTRAILSDALSAKPRVNPLSSYRRSRRYGSYIGSDNAYDLPHTGELLLPQARAPVGRFLFILAVFTLVVGPGSVYVARRRGPTALLLTIPATALVTCLLIVSYSMVVDGFDTHARTLSVTLLDARRHRAVTIGVAALYANLSPGGARFGTAAAIRPPLDRSQAVMASVDWTRGADFGPDLVPSRTYREWGIGAVEPARARLVVKQDDGGGVRVQNALGGTLRRARFKLRGEQWAVANIPDGGEARATPDDSAAPLLDEDEVRGFISRFEEPTLVHLSGELGEGRFVARLEGPGFLPLGGLDVKHHDSVALVAGEVE